MSLRGETRQIISTSKRLAARVGATLIPDPSKIAAFEAGRAGGAGSAFASCPCCGSVVPASSLDTDAALSAVGVPPITRNIVGFLARRMGQWVPLSRIISHAWNDDADGGPTDAGNNIDSRLSRARSALHSIGFKVEATWNQRRLVRVS